RAFISSPAVGAANSRIQINATVSTGAPPSVTSSRLPGVTDEIDCTTGVLKCHRPPVFLSAVALAGAPGDLILVVVTAAGNDPCVLGSPDLSVRGLVTIDRTARTLSFSGATTAFPAFEMYADFGSGPVPLFTRPPVVNSLAGLLVPVPLNAI